MSEVVKTGFNYVPFEERPGGSNRPKAIIEEEPEDEPPKHCGDGVGLAKMTGKQLKAWHNELRINLPKLTYNDIRRHKLPLHISTGFELEEEGLPKSAAYINELIECNNAIREAAGPDTVIWSRPKLMDNRAFIDRLRQELSKAEKAQMANNIRDECRSYLKLAVFFMNEKNCWWWIAEQLFMKSVDCVVHSKDDSKKIEAIVRYIYGMFLLTQIDDVDGALFQLQLAREFSEGTTWTATRELKRPQLSVFVETCRHLYKALLLLAIRIRDTDPTQSVQLCKAAYKRAVDADMPGARAEALFEKGLSYQEDNQHRKALKCLLEHLQLCKFLKNSQGVCNSYLEIAFCHKGLGDSEQTLYYLKKFQELAESENLLERLAEAHRYLGEFLLNLGDTDESREHFAVSFSLYFKLGLRAEIEEVRALACIAEGLGLLPLYAQLVKDSDVNGPSTVRLLRWKDIRMSFWGDAGCVYEMNTPSESSSEAISKQQSGSGDAVARAESATTDNTSVYTIDQNDDAVSVEMGKIEPEESDSTSQF